MSRVDVKVKKPWSNETILRCPVIGGKYVPISYIAGMLNETTYNMTRTPNLVTKHQVNGGGTMRNFVTIDQIRHLLITRGIENVDAHMAFFEAESAPDSPSSSDIPMRKRASEDEVKPKKITFRIGGEKKIKTDEPPAWAKAFMLEISTKIGDQAMADFKTSAEYERRCSEEAKKRVDDIEQRMLPLVEARLERELRVKQMEEETRKLVKIEAEDGPLLAFALGK